MVTDDAGRVLLCQQRHGHQRWGLPGGGIRPDESPVHAVLRDIFAEIGTEIELVDLVGLYTLSGDSCGDDVPDLVTHVFRGRLSGGREVALNSPKVGRLMWCDTDALPEALTATTRAALADAAKGCSGVLRAVSRDPEPVLT
ncbi:hypothetical protein Val02_89180 [Virgisporangium aliadipatigenens]|uniref:Nudix hydrolase domain-containing protein n=1 Tax=Virgisporangium aliadipatigenens TaxID=741659 RepID=A0A8J4DXF1_9ACTN|nr:hypothetical protein Val02_89180 [Virgisporangium aliadipatigenens]